MAHNARKVRGKGGRCAARKSAGAKQLARLEHNQCTFLNNAPHPCGSVGKTHTPSAQGAVYVRLRNAPPALMFHSP